MLNKEINQLGVFYKRLWKIPFFKYFQFVVCAKAQNENATLISENKNQQTHFYVFFISTLYSVRQNGLRSDVSSYDCETLWSQLFITNFTWKILYYSLRGVYECQNVILQCELFKIEKKYRLIKLIACFLVLCVVC